MTTQLHLLGRRAAARIALSTAAAGFGATRLAPPALAATPPTPPVAPDRRLIFTYYYYWYDAVSGGHMREEHGLRYHLPNPPAPNWRDEAWHRRQFTDMAFAGVDVALAVYWGYGRPTDEWSWQALPVMGQARKSLRAQGVNAPSIGLFLDTAIVDRRDLTTPDGKAWFYANFKDFFTRLPREHWALVNGRPVAFLFTSDFTAAMNQSTFDHVYERFQADFGVRPYIVRESSWDYPFPRWENGQRVWDRANPIRTENSYLWAASIHGYRDYPGGVAAIGPGYDDRRVPGGGIGHLRERNGGRFYGDSFIAAIASGKPLLSIETWNEMHEGSSICDTVEYGREYLEYTRQLAHHFHASR